MYNKVLALLINSNLWVGFAVACLALLSFPYPFNGLALVYAAFLLFGTTSAYSYMRWVKMLGGNVSGQPLKVAGSEGKVSAFVYSFVNGLLAIFFAYYLYHEAFLFALFPALVIAVFYPIAMPHPTRAFTSLRSVPMLKLLLISFSWAWMSYALPLILEGKLWGLHEGLELLFRSLLIAGLTIPFDVRDQIYDSVRMKTLPQILGVERALLWSGLLLLSYELWIVFEFFTAQIEWQRALAWILGLEWGARLIKGVQKNNSEIYIGFWVEGIPVAVFIFALIIYFAGGNF